MGCWNWSKFARELVKECFNSYLISDEAVVNILYDEIENQQVRRVVTVCKRIFEENKKPKIFYEILKRAIEGNAEATSAQNEHNIYHNLAKLRPVWVTTNADTHIHHFAKPEVFSPEKPFRNPTNLKRDTVYHIHGSLMNDDFVGMVFSLEEYVKRYNEENFRNFLRNLFSNWTVLFLGYGLNEVELLQFLKTNDGIDLPEKNSRFVLKGYNSHENARYSYDQWYYKSLGIEIIPFNKEVSIENYTSYDLQIPITRDWIDQLRINTRLLESTKLQIDETFQNPTQEESEHVLRIVRNDATMAQYFHKRLVETSSPLKWFDILKENGLLLMTKISNERNFRLPDLVIANFLKNCQNQLKNEDKSIDELIQILDKNAEIVNSSILEVK
ncbi:MAG: hypothetical protein HeimC2_00530 [Candidatus Heimdallarchaeota archaeon LC_2]|nr:MAG: hypothetical protein HeimC2_00530 [Candidatus Heimdallarchaeota archaeon LC_2]